MTDSLDRRHAGFKRRTRLDAARDALSDILTVTDRVETQPLAAADGRILAEDVTASRDVPHYPRAAMDGWAVRAEDTFGASDRSPVVLRTAEGEVDPGDAVRVHTGSKLPEGASAVVMIEHAEEIGGELEIYDAVAEGENVGPVGEDVARGTRLYETGHQLRPSDLGLLKSLDIREVTVRAEPEVAVIPTGEEVVEADPGPGEVIETNALSVSSLVNRWGGSARYRDIVTDDEAAIRAAIERDLDADVVVTTGGSSVGARDLTPEVLSELGEVVVHGVAIKPGHPVGIGRVEETPVLLLPGYPVSCIVNAWLFLRPTIKEILGTEVVDPPTATARVAQKIRSEPGMRTLARVELERNGEDEPAWTATPVSASGAGVLSTVALADGWVQVPESMEGIPAGEVVSVERWEALL
jgi:molybdopterin molybdotransferase